MRWFVSLCIGFAALLISSHGFAANGPRAQFMAELPRPALVLFYSANCTPCHAELNALPQLAQAAAGFNFVIATLSGPDPELVAMAAGNNVRLMDVSNSGAAILQSLNHNRLALPFAFSTGPNGRLCGKQIGLLGTKRIAAWKRRCLP